MINLNIQIKLIIFSLIFGFMFSIILDVLYMFLSNKNKFMFISLSFIFICFMTIIYFIGIDKIGYVIFHFYSIICIIIGFISYDLIFKMIANRGKK